MGVLCLPLGSDNAGGRISGGMEEEEGEMFVGGLIIPGADVVVMVGAVETIGATDAAGWSTLEGAAAVVVVLVAVEDGCIGFVFPN
jgi:hypothetical protein